MAKDVHDTPAMRQFRRFKQAHPDCLLLFRMGDFYELFYEDAKTASRALGLTLTQRTEGIPMAGVPYHQLDAYLRRLLKAGYRVAVCDQIEDAAQAKGLVERDVRRVVTPGTLTDESLLDEGRENPLAAVQLVDDEQAAVALVELSTGAFKIASLQGASLRDELVRLAPSELLYVDTGDGRAPQRIEQLGEAVGCSLTPRPAWQFRRAEAHEALARQFNVATLAGLGIGDDESVIGPAGAVVRYLLETQQTRDGRLAHLRPPGRFDPTDHMVIDAVSLRSLEVERTMRSGEVGHSLLGVINDCCTAMGKRRLRQWLCYPLRDRERIEQRQEIVAAISGDARLSEDLVSTLRQVQDVQRITSRISIGRPSPRDMVALGESAASVDALADLVSVGAAFEPIREPLGRVGAALRDLAGRIHAACVDTPPAHMRDGGLIRDGYDAELDGHRTLQRDSNTWLADYQKSLIDETGIDRLKVGYNKVFGYYIEVSHAQSSRVPDRFIRKQTLKNAERYITPQLKDFEHKVLSAQTKAISREQALFDELVHAAADRLDDLLAFADAVAALDVLACFARRAAKRGYVRPTIVDPPVLQIAAGRHPVLEQRLADQFVANDVTLGPRAKGGGWGPAQPSRGSAGPDPPSGGGTGPDQAPAPQAASLALITGPNMAGKSTYIRQTALLVLMAHTGSFIPADSATIGLTDRIFTRIGASDELHAGQSTFMVEMVETANICHHATPASLVILDEIGRGTSTLDGLSLAWAIAEHLARRGCRALFATHYHELTALTEQFDNVANLNVAVREWADEVVFLHRIQPGATDRSYGIHVAKIAGLPPEVVTRANQLMGQFELHTSETPTPGQSEAPPRVDPQPTLFTHYVEHPATDKLREADIERMSPLEAFDLLRRIQDELSQ
ncbi:MAG: DNA mismatch repair protein MutS [Planctomycetes bacterium]|jgi:DNA mismatch repair protein MutS|nr:DNA mismatch repair protein MutS [Planctomycetota bacterium]